MEIQSVECDEGREAFLSLVKEVYRGRASWLATSEAIVGECLRGASMYSARSRTRSFVALEAGVPVARAMAQIDGAHHDYWAAREGVRVGHVLFFEALPARRAGALGVLTAACEWLREQGCDLARMGYLHGRQMPLVIDGYDEPPLVFHAYNPSYYHAYIKDAGFQTGAAFSELCIDLDEARCRAYALDLEMSAARGVHLLPFDRAQAAADAAAMMRLYNDAFAGAWGWTPLIDVHEVMQLLTGEVLVDDFLYFAHVGGELAGFMLGIPDVYQAITRASGGGEVDHGLLLWAGVRAEFRGMGVARALASRICLSMRARGYQRVSPTVVADENTPSRRLFAGMGAYVRRNFVTYLRRL